jgi:hypothetical protein
MFDWLRDQHFGVTWWMWCLIGILVILAVNTLFCSIESIAKKRGFTQWFLFISPQIIHIGFLFILLAHLLSALGGSQAFSYAGEGSLLRIPENNIFLKVKDISIYTSSRGYVTDWAVQVEYHSNSGLIRSDNIRPNKPSVNYGLNINVKDVRTSPHKMVLLQINKEPGAPWALAGGILFVIGVVILIALRIKLEKKD